MLSRNLSRTDLIEELVRVIRWFDGPANSLRAGEHEGVMEYAHELLVAILAMP